MSDKVTHFEHGAPCPACGENLDAATDVELEGAQPNPGDFSACARCSTILVYDDPPAVHRASNTELATLSEKERTLLLRSLEVTRAFQRRHDE